MPKLANEQQKPSAAHARWYDSRPPVKETFQLIRLFPQPFQPLIADAANTLADKRFKVEKKIKGFTSLGQSQVVALYNANKRRRAMDQCEQQFQMYRYMLILPPNSGDDLAAKTTRLMRLLGRYFRSCQNLDTRPQLTVGKELIEVFVYKGEKPAESILSELEHTVKPLESLSTLQTYQALKAMSADEKLISVPVPATSRNTGVFAEDL